MNRQLLQPFRSLIISIRSKGMKYPGGVRYPGGIMYYPRFPNEKEPECTPSKLFRIERIKPLKGTPSYLKIILRRFKIDEEENRVNIVKNIPEVNAKLWKIKHLIRVTPITFPYGEPTAEDIKYTILKQNGQCLVKKSLQPLPESVDALDNFQNDPKKINSETLKRDSRLKWLNPYNGGF